MPNHIILIVQLILAATVLQAQGECIRGTCIEGHGLIAYEDGRRYEGDFSNSRHHGPGILSYPDGTKYIGDWENGQRQGKGRLLLANGDVFFGGFKGNQFHGHGIMTYADGTVYEGVWSQGQATGNGLLTQTNGLRYQGEFVNGERHGQGTMLYPDGSRYEGEWQQDERQGLGTYYYANGEQVSGQWERGEYLSDWSSLAFTGDTASLRNCNLQMCTTGKGKFSYHDGSKYIGDFSNGIPEGVGTVYYRSGNRYDGGWSRHAPHGKGVMHYTDGKVIGAIWDYGNPVRQLFEEQREPTMMVEVERSPEVKIWAVVVGAARYTHMPVLRYTDDDAYQLYAFLKSPEGGALPDQQVKLLIDEDATLQGITNAMKQVFMRADENDMVMFYFSGHGLQGAFLPVDYDGYANRLEHETIRQLLQQSRAKHKLVLADACHAGSLLAARAPIHVALRTYYEALSSSRGGTALLLSSKGEEYSLEDRGLRSGIFSHFLIRGLKGEANFNADNIITVRELFSFVHEQVRKYTGNIQTPTLSGDFDDNMPVGVLRR